MYVKVKDNTKVRFNFILVRVFSKKTFTGVTKVSIFFWYFFKINKIKKSYAPKNLTVIFCFIQVARLSISI